MAIYCKDCAYYWELMHCTHCVSCRCNHPMCRREDFCVGGIYLPKCQEVNVHGDCQYYKGVTKDE